MQPTDDLQCPYCTTPANATVDSSRENPSPEFDVHYTGVTCRDCGDYYEIAYEITTTLRCPECNADTSIDILLRVNAEESRPRLGY